VINEREWLLRGQQLAGASRVSRRRLCALLGALFTPLGLTTFRPDGAGAKKRHNKHKKRKKHGQKGKRSASEGYSPDAEERAFLDLINDYRRKNGAAALTLNDQLGAAARHHSSDMAKKNYFSHKLSNGDSPEENIRRYGYTHYTYFGENIAAGQESADKVFQMWEGSAEHAKNMRSKHFQEIGIGRAYSQKSKYKWYWTTTFGGQ
jgi:uncharacterized protein YkwD